MGVIGAYRKRKDETPMIKKGAVLILCAILILHLTACRSNPGPLSSQKAVDIMSPSQTAYDWPETPQEVYTLTVAVAIAKGTPSGQALLAIKEELEQRSNGAVTLDIFWESTLGGAPEIAESVTTGTVDIGLVSSAVISNYTHAIDVLSLPFIIENRQQFKAVLDNCFDEVTKGMDETIGIPLGLWEFGFRHLCTTEKEVLTVEDCARLTIRVMDGQVYKETFEALGCITSNIANSELTTAMQQGVVDGAEEPMATICNQQQYVFCDYVVMLGYNYSAGCPVLSAKTTERLPREVLDLLEQVFSEYRYYTIDEGERFEQKYINTCLENGMTVHYLSQEEMERFKETVMPVWEEYADLIGRDLIEQVVSLPY